MSKKLWELVCKTDPKYTKNVSEGGRRYTDIDPMWLIMRGTELFGPYGSTWGLKNLQYSENATPDGKNIYATLTCKFYYPSGMDWSAGEFEISNDMLVFSKAKLSYNDDWRKKLETNTLSKAMSKIGFGADVFLGMFENAKYVAEVGAEYEDASVSRLTEEELQKLKDLAEETGTSVEKICQAHTVSSVDLLPRDSYERTMAVLTRRKEAKAKENA